MEHFLTVGLILVCFGLSFVWAQTEKVYFVVSKDLELRPPPGVGTIDNIMWRLNNSIVVEWAKGDTSVTIYPILKDRATLNTATGSLEIKGMAANNAGEYSVEINSNLLDHKYLATAIEEVPKPEVWVSPTAEGGYQLTCEGNVENAGPVTYWWDLQEEENWVKFDQRVILQKNETTLRWKTFSCKISNPVSEKESDAKPNPMIEDEEKGNPALWALVLLPIAVLFVLGILKRKFIKAQYNSCLGRGEGPVNNASSVSATKNETENLNAKEGNGG